MGKDNHRDDNILYVTLVLAAWAHTIFSNHQGTHFRWMQFIVCAVFLAWLIKQLLPMRLWEEDNRLSKAEVLEEVIERIKMLGMCWRSFCFQRSPTKKEELGLSGWSPSKAGKGCSSYNGDALCLRSETFGDWEPNKSETYRWRKLTTSEGWMPAIWKGGLESVSWGGDETMQANQAVQANLNVFHLDLSTLFHMASRQLLVIVREGHRPIQRPVNKSLQA